LTKRDTLLPFLVDVCGIGHVALALLANARRIVTLMTPRGRESLKSALLTRLLAGRNAAEVQGIAHRFAVRLVSRGLRDEVVRIADVHRRDGCGLVIISASPYIYVREVAELLRFDDAIATRLEVVAGKLTGAISGPWVTRQAKASLLLTYLGSECELRWAYGNDSKDTEMLALATNPRWM
jgi:HAD superfamily phosphoserine phosphatase-like hydrolase